MVKKILKNYLVEQKIAKDEKHATAMVLAGEILINDIVTNSASRPLSTSDKVRVRARVKEKPQGYHKLKKALEFWNCSDLFQNAFVLDIGASTGGFTLCALEYDAKHVVALDVGTNQLMWQLRNEDRITSIENTHLEKFDSSQFPAFDIILCDISFQSTARLSQEITKHAIVGKTHFFILVKPQFELPRDDIPKGGIVSDDALRKKAERKVESAFVGLGCKLLNRFDSTVKGRKGNQEIFLHLC